MPPTLSGSRADARAESGITHGDTITVFALGPAGPYVEGRARVVAACGQAHCYRVRFFGEKTIRTRFIHPDWQNEPERCLALLRQFWLASTFHTSTDEFFPDDPE